MQQEEEVEAKERGNGEMQEAKQCCWCQLSNLCAVSLAVCQEEEG